MVTITILLNRENNITIAGYSKKDIEVEDIFHEGVLTVKSIKDVTDGDDSKLYSGIANRQFTRKFTLSDDIIVKKMVS